jgi:hypothetical protein
MSTNQEIAITSGIHPTVILTISDYYTRMLVNSNNKIHKVFGGLLGQNLSNKCEIYSAFEFYNQSEDDTKINLDFSYIEERRKLTEQLYPNYEILGFFTTNNDTSADPSAINELLKAMDYFGVVAPICLVLGTDLTNVDELPLCVYRIDRVNDKFIKLDHIIEGYESERICLDTVTKSTDFQNNESAMIQNMLTLNNAIGVLKNNLKLIKNSISEKKFVEDPNFISMLDELVKNYPNVCNPDLIQMLHNKEEEIFILNNICADSVDLSLQGRIECLNCMNERRGITRIYGEQ